MRISTGKSGWGDGLGWGAWGGGGGGRGDRENGEWLRKEEDLSPETALHDPISTKRNSLPLS